MRITLNNLQDVYKSPLCSVETMELRGYELIENLFVDNSRMGADDEPALTVSKFEYELTRIIKANGLVHTSITDQGQFQVYVGVFKHTGKKLTRKIANNTWEVLDNEGRVKAIRLHDTNIITYLSDGKIKLDSGGWQTHTTKTRMNRYLSGYTINQKAFEWYITTPNRMYCILIIPADNFTLID